MACIGVPSLASVNLIPEFDDRKAAVNAMNTRVERQPSSPWLLFPLRRQTFESDVQVQKLGFHVARRGMWCACVAAVHLLGPPASKKAEVHRLAGNESSPEQVHALFYEKDRPHPPLTLTMHLNEAKLRMEVDTGAAVSLISDATFKSLWSEASRPPIQPSSVLLCTYTGEQLTLVGQVSACRLSAHNGNTGNGVDTSPRGRPEAQEI